MGGVRSRAGAVCAIAVMVAGTTVGSTAQSANYGTDFNLTAAPAAGGMGGVGYASPQDPVASVFGNPATLTQFEKDYSFTFSAIALHPDIEAEHDGSVTGTAWKADSSADFFVLPNVALIARVTDELSIGGGIGTISGLASDFTDEGSASLEPISTVVVFGANLGAAYDVLPWLTIGGGATLGIGLAQAGILGNTAVKNGFGIRGDVGAIVDLGPARLGLAYQSPLSIIYDKALEAGPFDPQDLELEQPQQVALGISTTPSLFENALVEFDVAWKDWGSAETYGDLWKSQYIFSVGAQYELGGITPRIGYSYATSLRKGNLGTSLGDFRTLNVAGARTAITPGLLEYLQATLVEAYWQQQVTAGLSYDLSETLRVDLHGAFAFDGQKSIGGTKVDAQEFQAGIGLTFGF